MAKKTSELAPTGDYYIWYLTDDEVTHIKDILDCDLPSLGITQTNVVQDRVACPNCSKLSGLDDFVENALRKNIHTPEFMIQVLRGEHDLSGSPQHKLECSRCQKSFGQLFGWATGSAFNWVHNMIYI